MRVVTTCHKAGWKQYGTKTYEGLSHWPSSTDFYWYAEGFDVPPYEHQLFGVLPKRCESLPKLEAFKARHKDYVPSDWRFDVVRFANKVYAAYDALYDYDGIGVWMDADCIALADIPDGYIESLLPQDHYIAMFQRDGWHSETGLWVVDCAHPQHKAFLDHLIDWYESARFREAHEWHDCVLMDATVRAFQRDELIKAHNLSGPWSKEAHPMARHPVARYLDHMKGEERKRLGYSPERKQQEGRQAA